MYTNYFDSEFCGQIPIHLTNLTQPYGVLLVVNRNLDVIQRSGNASVLFSSQTDINLKQVLPSEEVHEMIRLTDSPLGTYLRQWNFLNKQFPVWIHHQGDFLVIEVDVQSEEYDAPKTFLQVYQDLRDFVSSLSQQTGVEQIAARAASELRRLSGFDKVMIYRFDAMWNGYVLAESCDESMERFIGFMFPASDIPRQARELYKRTPYRFIPDVDARPEKLTPLMNPLTNAFLDLSLCNLRSVALVHAEYLRNMNVRASLSIRILHQNELWGLITCHHRQPRPISHRLCSLFELASNVLSSRISAAIYEEFHNVRTRLASLYATYLESVYVSGEILGNQDLLTLFSATGVAVADGCNVKTTGVVPPEDFLDELLLWLETRPMHEVMSSSALYSVYEPASSQRQSASGLLVIPASPFTDKRVLLFRPEILQVLEWGGDPHDRIQFEEDGKRYHPRSSFASWRQQVEGVASDWHPEELAYAEMLRNFFYEFERSRKGRA